MKKSFVSVCIVLIFSVAGKCQNVSNLQVSKIISSTDTSLFDLDKILEITLKGNMQKLLNNRNGEAEYFPILLSYKNGQGNEVVVPIQVKTRGHFRREKTNCTYPPLLLKFPGNNKNFSYFPANSSLKLVMPCRGDQFTVHEWLVYKLYNLVTPQSFRARLVKVNLENENNKIVASPFYGIILEEEKQMARRNNGVILKKKIKPQEIMQQSFLKMAVFEYLIANTDWSVEYLQNIKLVAATPKSAPVGVPYDFDLAGIVNSPYAKPAEELQMRSVRERRYRGYCVPDMKLFDSTIAFYNGLKTKIYDTYTNCSLLDSKYVRSTIQFLDEFYATLNNPKLLKRAFQYPCLPGGTGDVIIKGLKKK